MSWILEHAGSKYTLEETRYNIFLRGAVAYLERVPKDKCPFSLLHIYSRLRWFMGWDEAQTGRVVLKRVEDVL